MKALPEVTSCSMIKHSIESIIRVMDKLGFSTLNPKELYCSVFEYINAIFVLCRKLNKEEGNLH